jgi:mono/diheme cytochrome c family protein
MAGRSSVVGIVALVILAGAVWALTGQPVEPAPPPAFADPPVHEKAPKPKPLRVESPRATFGHMCGTCHTLRSANATGLFGPDLDEVEPSMARVRRMIRTGSRNGIMPANLVRGPEAHDIAEYVARVAGRRGG